MSVIKIDIPEFNFSEWSNQKIIGGEILTRQLGDAIYRIDPKDDKDEYLLWKTGSNDTNAVAIMKSKVLRDCTMAVEADCECNST